MGIFVLALKQKKVVNFALFECKRNTPNSVKNESKMRQKQKEKRYTHKTSGFKTSDLQNVRFTKCQVSKSLVSKRPVFKFDILTVLNKSIGIAKLAFLFKVKSVSFSLITSDYGDIWQKTPSKIENKTQPSLCLQTWLQQNLRISTNHKYRIYMIFFATGCLEDLTFCKPDVL